MGKWIEKTQVGTKKVGGGGRGSQARRKFGNGSQISKSVRGSIKKIQIGKEKLARETQISISTESSQCK
jgi:hypothetical protein